MMISPEVILSKPTEPKLAAHHGYRSWSSFWYDASGAKRCKRFGKEGVVSKRQAVARFNHWMQTKWGRFEHVRNPEDKTYTIDDLCRDYLEHARTIYVKNGEPTTHISTIEPALDALSRQHGDLPADELDAPRLAALRDAMIYGAATSHGVRVRSMKTVNGRLYCIKQAFVWAREKGLVSAITLGDILAVKPLAKGRSAAKDPKKIKPVPEELVRATMNHLPKILQDMVELLWLTGMRPGEACLMRPVDIDTTGEVWVYRPHSHKTEHHDKERFITLGPTAQNILRPYLKKTTNVHGYIFTPAAAMQERREDRHAKRKTPESCGNTVGSNVAEDPQWVPGEVYTHESLRKAIHHACELAFKMPEEFRRVKKTDTPEDRKEKSRQRFAWRQQYAWNPNQLRHAWATRVRKQFGIEEASVGLGHSSLNTTEIYAERDLERSKDVARKIG